MKALRKLFSPEQHLKTQKRLNLMSRRGPIYDYKGIQRIKTLPSSNSVEIINTGGKVWPQPAELISTYSAKAIPQDWQIEGKPAKVFFNQSPVTLLAVSYAAFSDAAVESFTTQLPVNLPRLLLRPIMNPLKWLLWSRLIPKTPNTLVLRGDLPGADEVFEMQNKVAAYVFLIDSAGLIRWKSSGPATESDLKTFHATINALLH